MDRTLVIVGIVLIAGAIVGGGLKFYEVIDIPFITVPRQALLGVLGLVTVGLGLVAGADTPDNAIEFRTPVAGNTPWTDTGKMVGTGDRVQIDAEGSVYHDVLHQATSRVGPDGADDQGELNEPGKGSYVNPPGHAGLVAMVNAAGGCNITARPTDVIPVGKAATFEAPWAGSLCLGINDYDKGNPAKGTSNNTGSFLATVRLTVKD